MPAACRGGFFNVSKMQKLINLYQTPFPAALAKKRVDTNVSEYGKPIIRYQSKKIPGFAEVRRQTPPVPDVRHVVDLLVKEQGSGKKSAKQQLFKLFPYGYVKQACKIAGMQRPRVWSTG
jgi:sulfur relay (sulfurtransferase) DsrC/TusE family protein